MPTDQYGREKRTKILLLIKAHTEDDALWAAQEREIQISDLCHLPQYHTFRARANQNFALKVQKWYLEEGECTKGTGYPTGTLMFFSFE